METIHNIILFGEAGAGKSSIVNMLLSQSVAKTSNGARGCTFENKGYRFHIGAVQFRIYDTAGLNEGDQGRVPDSKAVYNIYKLIHQLDGVSLLIYCMKGRIKNNAAANWQLFHKVVCNEEVPIIAAVTGLEEEADLDSWWRRNENIEAFESYQLRPDRVACIVSYLGDKSQYERKYEESFNKLRNIIKGSYRKEPWSQEKAQWLVDIYKRTTHTRFCVFSQTKLEYTEQMLTLFGELRRESSIPGKDIENMKKVLLQAEEQLQKRWYNFFW